MIAPRHVLTALLLSLAIATGCASKDSGSDDDNASEEELGLRHGTVDHAGIVEASTMMLAGGPTSSLLDPYNQEDPFQIHGDAYAPTLRHRLAQFDGYDGATDWTEAQASAWATRMSKGNYLVLDTSKPCGEFGAPRTYLELERAALAGRDHTTCGGRMPNEDALDVTLNFLVRGPAASAADDAALHDGVDHATKASEAAFPYLAEMNGL